MRVVYDLVAFGFITPIKNAKGKKNANFRSRIQTLGKQILASVNFAPNRIGPSNIATTLEFVKKSASPTSQAHILHTSWSTFEVQRGPGHYQGHSLQRTKSLLSAVVDQAAPLASA